MKKIRNALFLVIFGCLSAAGCDLRQFPSLSPPPFTAEALFKPEGAEKNNIRWVFLMPDVKALSSDHSDSAGNSFPGAANIALKNYITELYTNTEPVTPGSSVTRIVIRKPTVFNAVKTIEKYYRSGLKKNELSPEQVTAGLGKVFEIAIAAATENTQEFEKVLQQNRKDALSLIAVFNQVQLKKM